MSDKSLCHLDVVVEGGKVESREAVVLGLVDGGAEGEVCQDEADRSHVPSERSMVEGVEAVAIGDGVVGLALDQKLNNVIPFLGDGIVKGRVSLRILTCTKLISGLIISTCLWVLSTHVHLYTCMHMYMYMMQVVLCSCI